MRPPFSKWLVKLRPYGGPFTFFGIFVLVAIYFMGDGPSAPLPHVAEEQREAATATATSASAAAAAAGGGGVEKVVEYGGGSQCEGMCCSVRAQKVPSGHPSMTSAWWSSAMYPGSTVQLSTHHGTWWGPARRSDGSPDWSAVVCNWTVPPPASLAFTVVRVSPTAVRLRTPAGKYLAAKEGSELLSANGESSMQDTAFTVVQVENGKPHQVNLVGAADGHFVTCTNEGFLKHYAKSSSTWERFYVREVMEVEAFRGVNLGGWLVVEPWMTPELMEGVDAKQEEADPPLRPEWHLMKKLGVAAAQDRLQKHYKSFVTRADFRFMKSNGVNAVRIPVGWWLADDGRTVGEWEFLQNHIGYLDRAFDLAAEFGIRVLLALHGGPDVKFFQAEAAAAFLQDPVHRLLEAVDWIALRYSGRPNYMGISLLSENLVDKVELEDLKAYYLAGYKTIRKHSPCAYVAIAPRYKGVINDLKNFMPELEFTNVLMEIHSFLAFNPNFEERPALDCIDYVGRVKLAQIDDLQAVGRTVLVGEWSLALNPKAIVGNGDIKNFGHEQLRVYGRAQAGWFFWALRMGREGWAQWSFEESVRNGWLAREDILRG